MSQRVAAPRPGVTITERLLVVETKTKLDEDLVALLWDETPGVPMRLRTAANPMSPALPSRCRWRLDASQKQNERAVASRTTWQ
jgi:hypothetical protein